MDDEEPKYGLAVTGTVHPERFMTAHGARPGDLLVLTKPLGTGSISTAIKAGAAVPWHVRQAVMWMTTLNRSASRAMMEAEAHAATDVTGYGLLGHLVDLCRASGVSAVIDAAAVPLLPGAREYARNGYVPGGTGSNLSYVEELVTFPEELDDTWRYLLADPQTSGGLLVALDSRAYEQFVQAGAKDMLQAIVGEVEEGHPGTVRVHF